jgi:hypothetical protein
MDGEDHCRTLSCYFPYSWDNLVMAIGSIVKTFVLDKVVISLFSEEVRWKASKSINEALDFHGRSKEKGKKREKGRSKSCGRHKS